ncbi:uncharacterized protein, partial [Phyllobates terribilis]|uniref:uncharacterized protein n=1 Tax=Phyllobates terribilis TaxID=111132 RepID=UPI003CCAE994
RSCAHRTAIYVVAALQVEVPTIWNSLSKYLLYKRIFPIDRSRMDSERHKMAERILHLSLEILFRLTGEDYTVVKKTSSECCQAPVSKGWGRPLIPITGPPPLPLIHKDINDQKILELAYKIIELLTGEVPIRYQDVAIYFSMEEWEYLEGHKDLYKDVMMEVPQPLTSPVLSSKRTTEERCPRPLLPQDCKQEDLNVPQDYQVDGEKDKNQIHINTTETYVRGDEQFKGEIPTDNYPVLSSQKTTPERCPRPLLPQDCKQEYPNVPQDHQDKDLTHNNTTETYVGGDERCKEEIPTDNNTVLSSKKTTPERSPHHLLPQDFKKENHVHEVDREQWEYLEGHSDVYKDIMMEVPQPLTSPVLSSKRTTPERCPHPLLPQDCNQENLNVPQNHQGKDLTHINTTETYVRGDEPCEEAIPTDNCTEIPSSLIPNILLDWKMPKQKRLSYKVPFKLEVVKFAKQHGNRAAERHFGRPPTEKMIREWRKQENQLKKMDKTKRCLRGQSAQWPHLELEMKEWVINHRINGFSVSSKMIIDEAKRIATEKGIENFIGTDSWCYRFMKRSGLAKCTNTTVAHKIPEEYGTEILSFHKFVIDARKRSRFELSQIGNMDEVPITFGVPSNRTVDSKGVKTSGKEETHYTVVLSCCADGTKLPPMIIFKMKNMPKEDIPRGIFVHVHERGWMDEDGMKVWIEKVWSKRPGGLRKRTALLVLDQYRAHTSESTKKRFKDVKTDLAVIPGDVTSQLQPLDVSINKPFKSLMREKWNNWMADLTSTEQMESPTITQVCKWVKTSWQSIKDETIVRSFEKCGISNALDGSEDNVLYEDGDKSDTSECEESFLNGQTSDEEFLAFPDNYIPGHLPAKFYYTSLDCSSERIKQELYQHVTSNLFGNFQKKLMAEYPVWHGQPQPKKLEPTSLSISCEEEGKEKEQTRQSWAATSPDAHLRSQATTAARTASTSLDATASVTSPPHLAISPQTDFTHRQTRTLRKLEKKLKMESESLSYSRRFTEADDLDFFDFGLASRCRHMPADIRDDFCAFVTSVASVFESVESMPEVGDLVNHLRGYLIWNNILCNILPGISSEVIWGMVGDVISAVISGGISDVICQAKLQLAMVYHLGCLFILFRDFVDFYFRQRDSSNDVWTVVKKTSSDRCQAPVSEEWGRTLSPITGPPPHPLMHEDINDQKILELTYKMIELLTGEVPIRCQDVTIYFSMEEWEYLEGHKDLYKDVVMEVSLPTTSPGDCIRISEEHEMPIDFKTEDYAITTYTYEEDAIIPDTPPALHSKDLSSDPFQQLLSYESSQTVNQNQNIRSDVEPSSYTVEDPFSCLECGKFFTRKTVLIDHQKTHTGEKPYSCSECGKCCTQKSDLVKHQRTHTGEKPYLCSECGKCFSQKFHLVRHRRSHTGEKPYSCPVCGKYFNQKSHVVRHQISHTGEKPFSCSECGKCFSQKSSLLAHEKIHTGEKPFSCLECGKCFNQKSNLTAHQKIDTGQNCFLCPKCGKRFTRKTNLVEHQKSHTKEKPFLCSKCGLRFTRKSNLLQHQKSHAGEKPFLCSECGKPFRCKRKLVTHQRTHTGEKPYSCLECGKCFTDKSNLITHQKIHTGVKPFSCSECGKCFKQKSDVVRHQGVHTGVKPFSCLICGKCFTQRCHLAQHQIIHTGEKPFSCLQCGTCFTVKSNLVKHERIHKGAKPFLCSECGKCFTQKTHLVRHQRVHTGEKPYSCSECGKYFSGKSNLINHQKTHTG